MRLKFKTVGNFIANHAILYFRLFQKLYRKLYPEQHQLTSTTSADRYPELFTEARKFGAVNFKSDKLSILSFGCSTGQECMSLKKYFPDAKIIGADINKFNLSKAERVNCAPDIKYIFSTPENIAKEGKYDLIFCLSVLCRWEDTKYVDNCESIYPFEKFEKTVKMLVDQLNVGGLMVIYNSNFRFEDTQSFLFGNFKTLLTPAIQDSGFVFKFDANNNRITETHRHCIYQKN